MHDLPIIKLGGIPVDLSSIIMITVTFIVVFVLCLLATRRLSVTAPSKLQNFMEWVVEFVQNIVASAMPLKKGRPFIGLGLTLILFIFVSNLLGLPFAIVTEHEEEFTLFGTTIFSAADVHHAHETGEHLALLWWKSPTADLSVTMGLAFIIFLMIHYFGVKNNRKHYLKHYVEPYPIFFPLNLIEQIARPVTLGVRLYANIYAGEILIATIVSAGWFGLPLMMAWQGFSLFVGGLQAFLFTMLAMVYISQATVHEEH
ncbi:F0F1 ATP synthase subunit A [Marinicrinis lubricantis]|uniref:ATP synthase subunit a n=1 Tax=Marinicrinis lubricantis TaxID=2086470 RepID=A0ABW1IL04_9BACL